MIVGNSLKVRLHRPVQQQIAEHAELLIQSVGTHAELSRLQGVIEGLRLAMAVQENVFDGTDNE